MPWRYPCPAAGTGQQLHDTCSMSHAHAPAPCRRGELVNMKYRQLPKQFWTRSGGRKVLYGYDDVWPGPDPASPLLDPATGLPLNHTIVIVEGEMDKLALNQAGLWNVVSVPFGAPSKAGDKQRNFESYDPLRDRNFSYIWECEDLLQGCQRVVIATDNDGPGYALQEELARRLGRWVRAAASALCGC
jgi:twinkle protein